MSRFDVGNTGCGHAEQLASLAQSETMLPPVECEFHAHNVAPAAHPVKRSLHRCTFRATLHVQSCALVYAPDWHAACIRDVLLSATSALPA